MIRGLREKEVKGYDKKKHPYAVRMLAELEDAQKEVSLIWVWCEWSGADDSMMNGGLKEGLEEWTVRHPG